MDLNHAFPHDPVLRQAVENALHDPYQSSIVTSLTKHIFKLQTQISTLQHQLQNSTNGHLSQSIGDAAARKRKHEENGDHAAPTAKAARQMPAPNYVATELSFAVPVRKKLNMEFYEGNDTMPGGLRAVNPSNNEVEVEMAWKDIDQIFLLPVPEKMQPSFNFVIIPSASAPTTPTFTQNTQPIVFSLAASISAPSTFPTTSSSSPPSYVHALHTHLNHLLSPFHKRVTEPSPSLFTSSIPQAHRKHEPAHHVKAFRGTKEGFLYFLPPGILFGFKKPLTWFPFYAIESVSYTSVLARTFNLNIVASGLDSSDPRRTEEIEFSMLDQAEHAGIDGYVKAHGLNDASLAEQRRAKALNINGPPPTTTTVEGARADGAAGAAIVDVETDDEDGGDPAGAALRAEKALQDREDEEEEDFDPGSGGESDGSGTDSEEEGEDGQEEYGDGEEEEEGDEEGDVEDEVDDLA